MASINTEGVRLRPGVHQNGSAKTPSPLAPTRSNSDHPMGAPKHGPAMQALRIVGFGIYFFGSSIFIHFAQLIGAPLYFFSKDWFYAYMALTKQYFGLLVTTMTQWWSPTVVRISGDKSMKGLIKLKKSEAGGSGMLEVDFGERVVLMTNHQIYTDWLYLWWTAYTNAVPMHGHLYIILKESLKWVPLIGPAMQFYGFIFMARKWSKDQQRLRYRLQKLNSRHSGPLSGSQGGEQLDPMWLLIFPEGTNLSANTCESSAKFSAKSGIPDMKHQLLPRSTGLAFCLEELKDTVPYLYDCTIAYEGIPPDGYGGDIFTLRSVYFQGRPPKSVNMHWRRFAIKDIPYTDHEKMNEWTLQRWREKDELIEQYVKTGRFPADAEGVVVEGGDKEQRYIDTEVKPRSPFEFLAMFMPVVTALVVGRVLMQLFDRVFGK
ncbi:hypothetical protein LTR09_005195 [Extremus antarcticus]|uniref:Phospholipid/glycerol acyltransferase domain-containing protein n=1 Tax=Extremus antarcticus TaxID=702011 RepID=A0AAJ0DGY9_9PEZI|nr:hypothetical protein LTR09_005195 [Extremus antarcticus]